jgi:hypothetical protein
MKRYIIAAAVSLPLLTGCQLLESLTESGMSVEDQAQLDDYQSQIAVLEQKIRKIEQEAEATFDTAVDEVGRGETELLGQRVAGLLELQEAHEALVADYAKVVSDERALLDGALKDQVGGFLTLAAPFIPAPAQPLIPFASTLLVFAISSRARKHAGKALAALAKGNLADMAAALLKASGAAHSSPTTKAVAEAEAKGEDVTVQVS